MQRTHARRSEQCRRPRWYIKRDVGATIRPDRGNARRLPLRGRICGQAPCRPRHSAIRLATGLSHRTKTHDPCILVASVSPD